MTDNDEDYDPERLAAAVREDPTISSREKKFELITWKDAEEAYIHCRTGDKMRQLIKHDSVTVTSVTIGRRHGPYLKKEPHKVTDGPIVAIKCEVPRESLEVVLHSSTDTNPDSDSNRDSEPDEVKKRGDPDKEEGENVD